MTANLPPRIGVLLGEATQKAGVADALRTGALWNRWARIMGADIAAHADPSSLREGVLRVRTDSPAWATEIGYLADEIRRRINDEMSCELVREIRVWTGPPRRKGVSSRTPEPEARGPAARDREGAATEDPAVALERARAAWRRGTHGRDGALRTPRENERKSW